MNTSTLRLFTPANFNIFALFFMLTVFSFNITVAQDCNWGQPTSLTIVNVGTTFASLTWQHPVQGPAPGGYEVSVIRVSNGNKVTYNVNDNAYIVNNLSPGIQYLIEIRPICSNGLVSPNFISKIVITVVINDLVYPICPLPDSTEPVVGNLIPETILSGNSTSPSASVTLTWPDFSPGTNRQVYYIEVGKVNTEGYKAKFVVVRDLGSNTFYHKQIGGYDQWLSKLHQFKYVKILNETSNVVCKGVPSLYQFTISKTSNIAQLKVKVDLMISCNTNNPQPLMVLNNKNLPVSLNAVSQEDESKSDHSEIFINTNLHEIAIFSNSKEKQLNDILIYDMNGRLILKDRCYINNEIMKISIADFISGLYVITVFNDENFKQMKFIKL
jgi:hypothetical protein